MGGRATSDTLGLIASRVSKLLSPESVRGGNHGERLREMAAAKSADRIEHMGRCQAPSKLER